MQWLVRSVMPFIKTQIRPDQRQVDPDIVGDRVPVTVSCIKLNGV